ncbi:DNA polymerase III subunit beta [Alicyclobacillus tolerans]|uniref:Beta sliding clamp n=1 Tax=Alicyclobacillus tolerans TaxID=90970 RepID=A0A1M6WS71_9BACL|nr:DNA polymerase III subunit beta [Alicyclobacillus montanus]SHK96375.1 DNA polymerase III, beta subunit [Alicyclobacillus montanus]
MKIDIQKVALVKALQEVKETTLEKATNFARFVKIAVNQDDSRVDFTTSNMEATTRVTVWESAMNTPVTIHQSGEAVVPYKMLSDMATRSHDTLTLSTEKTKLTIRTGKTHMELAGIDPKDFLAYQYQDDQREVFRVSASKLKALIQYTAFAASTSEVRPILTGVYLVAENGQLKASATDGLCLSTASCTLESLESAHLIIPATTLSKWVKHLPEDDDEEVLIQFGESGLQVTWDDDSHQVMMRALSGKYPDINRLIAQKPLQYQLRLNRLEWLQALERIGILSETSAPRVTLTFREEGCHVESKSEQYGQGSDWVTILAKSALPDFSITFNPRLLISQLKAMRGEEVLVGMNGPNEPVFFKDGFTDFDMLGLLSPVLSPRQQQQSA